VGYSRYLEAIADLLPGKEQIASGMTQETDRCRTALGRAAEGQTVALISSGDAGIYGMAGLAIELAEADGIRVPIEVVPGVTAASAAAAALGGPLMADFAVISLSDLLVPWEVIRGRLEAVARADLVVCLYNPRSRKRVRQLDEAAEIFLARRPASTAVGVVTAAGREDERIVITELSRLAEQDVNMQSTVIIGNRTTRRIDAWLVTARGYSL
jgi:precorrin-3B C17-methyltransferase